jgi:UDP-2,3-diacylglucosamine pyrophosphatase LpxH
MLVIISDLHLTDGTSGATISAGAFEIFAQRLHDLAHAASWRADGRYRPLAQLDIVLLGDVLDVIRSTRWLERRAPRPWSDPHDRALVEHVAGVTGDILRHNADSLALLRGLTTPEGVMIPPGTQAGQPDLRAAPLPVDVRLFYMVGNHDWFYHLPGEDHNQIRDAVRAHMGLSNAVGGPFAHEPSEDEALQAALRRHRVFARHGDIHDPFNYEGDRDASSLGDAIVVELVNRFAVEVARDLGDDLPDATVAGLRELDNIRPVLLIPVWIDGLLERTCAWPALRKEVKRTWDRLAEEFLALPFVRQRDSWHPADLVDGLERLLKFSQRVTVGWAAKLVAWLHGLRGNAEASFARQALAEQEFRNRRARYIVYGHTHAVETVALDTSFAESRSLEQVYFNSGTWRRVYRPAILAPHEHEFIATDVMTYTSFFQGDERKGRPYETWSGTLGLSAEAPAVRRIDRPAIADVAAANISASGLHGRAPHFAPASRATGFVPTRRE